MNPFSSLFLIFFLGFTNYTAAVSIKEVEVSLNSIKTFQADFLQLNHDGSKASGSFYLARPHHLKFEYEKPQGSSILAKEGWLRFYDADQEEESAIEIDQTPAKFLLADPISLTKADVKLKEMKTEGEAFFIKVTDLEETTTITLYFDQQTHLLKGWQVHDVQGNLTAVDFSNIKLNAPLDKNIFRRTHKLKSRKERL